MLGYAATIAVSSLALGALASRRVRNATFGDIEYDWLCNELEFDCLDADGETVNFKDGTLARIIRVDGIAYDAVVIDEQEALLTGRRSLFNAIGSAGCEARLFATKRSEYINYENSWPSVSLKEIGEAERKLFNRSFKTHYFILLSHKASAKLKEAENQLMPILKTYQPTILSGEALCGVLNYIVSGEYIAKIPIKSGHLNGTLPLCDFNLDRASGEIETRTPLAHKFRVISIKEWPVYIDGRIISDLLSIPFELEISHILKPYDSNHARLMLNRLSLQHSTTPWGNQTVLDDVNEGIQAVNDGDYFYHTQCQIILRAKENIELDKITTEVANILSKHEVKYSVDTGTAAQIWFNRLPRKKTQLVRPLNLMSSNLASLWCYVTTPVGQKSSPLGNQPVRLLNTPSGQAYQFQFHVSDKPQSLGHYLVFAASGTGKTTLMMHLQGGLSKFEGIRSYTFDSKEGARYMIEAMGGHYQNYDELAMNPLDVGEDSKTNRHRVAMILQAMIGAAVVDEEEIEFTVRNLLNNAFRLNAPERNLSNIFEMSFQPESKLRRLFAQWIVDGKGNEGAYAHIFNAPHDSLSSILSQSHMIGINMSEPLEDPKLGPAIVGHISNSIYQTAYKTPGFNIFIDEAAKLLENPSFLKLAKEMFREYRKLNGIVGMAFQDPAALFNTGESQAFIENASTIFFFPNAKIEPDTLKRFNLNSEQIDFIRHSGMRGEGRRVLVVKQEAGSGFNESVILDVDLAPLGNSTRFYKSGADANGFLQELKNSHGDAWLEYL